MYLYLRHFGQSLVFRPIAFGVGSLIAAWAAGVIVAACLQCYPLTAFWDHSVTDAQCIDQKSFMVVDQAFCVAINLAIMALPIPMLIRRRLSWQDKLGLVVVYAAGILYVSHHCQRLNGLRSDFLAVSASQEYTI